MENKKDKMIDLRCLKDARNDDSGYKLEIAFDGVRMKLYEGEGAMELYEKMSSHWHSLDNFLREIDVKPYNCDEILEGKICSLEATDEICNKTINDKVNPADTTYTALYLALAGGIVSGNYDNINTLNQTLAIVNQSPKIMVGRNQLEQMQKDIRA